MTIRLAYIKRPLAALLLALLCASAVLAQNDQAEKDLAFAQGLYREENYALAADKFAAFVKDYPTHANLSLALFRAGECFFRLGKFTDAEPYFARLTSQLPDSTEAQAGWVWLGDTRLQAQKYADAATAYATYLQKYPQADQAGHAACWLGESYYHQGKYPEAATAYKQALTLKLSDQEGAYTRYALGWTYLQMNDPDQAAESLQAVLDKFPTSSVAAESQYLLGTAQRLRKSYPAAVAAYQKTLAKYPDSKFAALAQMGLGWCYFEQQQYEPALEAFQKVTTAYPQSDSAAEARLRSADCLFHLRKFAAAAPVYEQAAAAPSPWAAEAQYWLAVTYEQIPDRDQAIAAHTHLTTAFPQSPHVADSYLHLGRLQLAAGKTDASLAAYQAAAAAATQPAQKQQAQAELAWARYQKTKSDAALADLETALRQDPSQPWVPELAFSVALADYNAARYQPALDLLSLLTAGNPPAAPRGDVLYLSGACQEKLGHPQQAEPLYRQALEGKDPEYAGLAGAALVNLYARQGNLDKARAMAADLQKSEASAPAKAFALNALGQALYDAKQYAEAEQTYAKVLALPDTAAAPYALLGSAWAKLALGDPTASDTFLSVAKQYPASPAAQKVPDGLLAVAEKLFSDGKYAEAQAAYQRLLEAFPQSDLAPAAQYKLGWSLLKQNKPEAALPYFVAAAPKATAPAVAADARYQAARLLLAASPAQAAALLEPFRDQYQDTPVAPAALVLWGRALTDEKQYDPAAAAYQLALTRYPKDPAAAEAGLGMARLYRLQKKLDQAREALTKTLATATGALGAEAQFELASLYRDQGDTKRAAEEFLKVAILYGDPIWSAQAQYQAGQCYEAVGDKPSATAAYKLVARDYAQQQPWADQSAARLKALTN